MSIQNSRNSLFKVYAFILIFYFYWMPLDNSNNVYAFFWNYNWSQKQQIKHNKI